MIHPAAPSEDEIKAVLRAMLAEANHRKERFTSLVGGTCLIAMIVVIGLVYKLLVDGLGFGGFMGGLLGFLAGLAALLPLISLDEWITGLRSGRLAKEFRTVFPEENGAYETALALLKGAKSETKVEKDLIAALDEGVTVGPKVTTVGKGAAAGGLLGDFEALEAGEDKTAPKPAPAKREARKRPDFIPLDPQGR